MIYRLLWSGTANRHTLERKKEMKKEENEYCRKCGTKLIISYRDSEDDFDIRTGKPVKIKIAKCPNFSSFLGFSNNHAYYESDGQYHPH